MRMAPVNSNSIFEARFIKIRSMKEPQFEEKVTL
jgi:hypothetical protein